MATEYDGIISSSETSMSSLAMPSCYEVKVSIGWREG